MDAELIDLLRIRVNGLLDKNKKVNLAQFMTPSNIADYMASLFTNKNGCLLDCGAGIGSLTMAVLRNRNLIISDVDCWELDDFMIGFLTENLNKINIGYNIYNSNFIEDSIDNIIKNAYKKYDYIISNPPYKKLRANSRERKLLSKVGIDAANLYSAFISLSILMLKDEGELVAIIPRSFCNGVYYKSFRDFILKYCSIEYIHIFNSRDSLFSDDNVLQENIIIKLKKKSQSSIVNVCYSEKDDFYNKKINTYDFKDIVFSEDENKFIRIPIEKNNKIPFYLSLDDLNLSVSTGPVVDFRIKEHLEKSITDLNYPLIYPHHFKNGRLIYPQNHKKPNAINLVKDTKNKLLPADSYYVVINRFSPKENKRRIIANLIPPQDKEFIAIENHLNFFHFNKKGLDEKLAKGITCYLSSSLVDDFFRTFSGHTQVNVGDLKNISYPNKEQLIWLGERYHVSMEQDDIDYLIDKVIQDGK